jgi:RNA polymerase sigma-70 factor (ECF subfamily)
MDEHSFRELTDPYRRELQVHCYRMVGSVQDAEDLVQETLLAAWRGLDGFEGRSSVRTWLYRIATNRCLNALRDRERRPREVPQMATPPPEPTRRGEALWVEPYPDTLLEHLPDSAPPPDARYEAREATALAFVAALQLLPPQQRAVLVLRDVLGFRATEAAELLETSDAAVKSALQRARATVDQRQPKADRDAAPLPGSPQERELSARFADAVESGDVDSVIELLTEDAWVTMPPAPLEYQGHAAIAEFLQDRALNRGGRALRLVPVRANGQPAFGCYLPDEAGASAQPYGLMVVTPRRDLVSAITFFGDSGLLRHFDMPPSLPG